MPRRPLLLETFEDRILSSVTAPGLEVPEMRNDFATTEAHAEVSHVADAASHEVVFVDTGVADFQKLVDDLTAQGSTERHFDVVLLDANRDGIAQVNDALAGRRDIDAIHFVTHGTDRAVKLGGTWIDGAAFEQFRGRISAWGDALSADADVLFYGCDLAGSAAGRDLLGAFASVTRADIEASSDATGPAALGANWTLEYHIGDAATGIAFTQTVTDTWSGVLNTFSVTNTANSGAGSLRQAILDANALAGADTIRVNIGGGGAQTISPTSALPQITGAVIIDATTQGGYAGVPLIELKGNLAGAGADGFGWSGWVGLPVWACPAPPARPTPSRISCGPPRTAPRTKRGKCSGSRLDSKSNSSRTSRIS